MKTIGQTVEFKEFENDRDLHLIVSSPISESIYVWQENDLRGFVCDIIAYDGLNNTFGVTLKELRDKELKDGQEVVIKDGSL